MIYLDTCLLIYLEEEDSRFLASVHEALASDETGVFAISALVKAECMVGAIKRMNPSLEASYQRMFSRFQTLDILESTFLLAARLRAQHGYKLPDALHLACAQENGCSALWTNDDRMAGAGPGYALNILR